MGFFTGAPGDLSVMSRVMSLGRQQPARYDISGYTRDASGNALGAVTVKIFETVSGLFRCDTVSDSNGYYTVQVTGKENLMFSAICSKAGYPDVTGTPLTTLAGSQRPGTVNTPVPTSLLVNNSNVANGGFSTLGTRSVVLSGTSDPNVMLDGYVHRVDAGDTVLGGQGQSDGAGNWSVSYLPFINIFQLKVYELTVLAVDVANNYSALSIVWSFTGSPAP